MGPPFLLRVLPLPIIIINYKYNNKQVALSRIDKVLPCSYAPSLTIKLVSDSPDLVYVDFTVGIADSII